MSFVIMLRYILTLIIAPFLLACSQQNFGLESQSQVFGNKVVYNTEVDVLLVIDTSASMSQHQKSLAKQVAGFTAVLDKTGLDYQIAVTTMDMGKNGTKGEFLSTPVGTTPVLRFNNPSLVKILSARVQAGETGSTVERGLEAMKSALSSPNRDRANLGFVRKNALLVVIFLTNEEDESSSEDYAEFLDTLKPPLPSGDRSWIAHFIGVLPNDRNCQSADWNYHDPGLRYIDLVNESGGRAESICSADLSVAVDRIQSRIIEIITEYPLGDRKANKDSIRVYVNGQLLAQSATDGWTYDANKNSITFHGTGVPSPGSIIKVDFDPEEIK